MPPVLLYVCVHAGFQSARVILACTGTGQLVPCVFDRNMLHSPVCATHICFVNQGRQCQYQTKHTQKRAMPTCISPEKTRWFSWMQYGVNEPGFCRTTTTATSISESRCSTIAISPFIMFPPASRSVPLVVHMGSPRHDYNWCRSRVGFPVEQHLQQGLLGHRRNVARGHPGVSRLWRHFERHQTAEA